MIFDYLCTFSAHNSLDTRLKLGTSCGDKVGFQSLKTVKRYEFFNDSVQNAVSFESLDGYACSFQYTEQRMEINEGGLGKSTSFSI